MRSNPFSAILVLAAITLALSLFTSRCLAQNRPDFRWMRGGQVGSPNPIAWSPDGQFIAIPNWFWVSIYRASDGMLLHQLPALFVPFIAFLPDNSLVTLDQEPANDHNSRVQFYSAPGWDISRSSILSGKPSSLEAEPNGLHLIINQKLYNTSDLSLVPFFADIKAIHFTPKAGSFVLYDSHYVWRDISTNDIYATFSTQWWVLGPVSPSLTQFLGTQYDASIAQVASFPGGPNLPVRAVIPVWWQFGSWNHDGTLITGTRSTSATYGVWDAYSATTDENGTVISPNLWMKTDAGAGTYANVAFAPNDNRLAVSPSNSGDSNAKAFTHIDNGEDGSVLQRLTWRGSVDYIAHSPDGTLLAAISQGGPIQIWRTSTRALVNEIHQVGELAYSVTFADNHTVIVGHGGVPGNNLVKAYNVDSGAVLWSKDFGAAPGIVALTVSRTGIVVGAFGNTIYYFDPVKDTLTTGPGVGRGDTNILAYSPDGTKLAASDSNGYLQIIGSSTPPYPTISPRSMEWSPDGKKILVAGIGGATCCRVIDVSGATWTTKDIGVQCARAVATWDPCSNLVAEYVFAANGSGATGGHLAMVDATTGAELRIYTSGVGVDFGNNHMTSLHFAANGQTVAFGCTCFTYGTQDGTVGVFDNPFYMLPKPASITSSPATPYGGTTATGTVALDCRAPIGGALVALASSDTTVATVPAIVAIPEGAKSATFPITAFPTAAPVKTTLKATYNGASKTKILTIKPAALNSLAVNPVSVTGGTSAIGTATMIGILKGDTVLTLSSDNPAVHVPASVTVLDGTDHVSFPATTNPVQAKVIATITGKDPAMVIKTVKLTVKTPALSTLALSPNPVVGGSTVTGTVTMSGPVAVDTTIQLTNANTKALLPNGTNSDSVTIPAGASSAQFTVTTVATTLTVKGAVKAMLGSISKSVTLTVQP